MASLKILWETALVFCLCSLSLVSSHSRKYTTPNVTRLTDQFTKIAIESGFSKRFGAPNILVNGSIAKLTLDKSSGNKTLLISVLYMFPLFFPDNIYIFCKLLTKDILYMNTLSIVLFK